VKSEKKNEDASLRENELSEYKSSFVLSEIIPMKILALIGTPRKESNTDLLVDQILKGGKESGHRYEKLYLYDYEILPCMDCRDCKRGNYVCSQHDGMKKIYP
jgi:hypothetical protein